MSFKILVTARSFRRVPGKHKELLEEAGCNIVESPLDHPLREAELLELISDVDGAIMGLDEVTAKVIATGKRLRVISRYGVGVDNVDLKAATAAGVVVTNTPGANSMAVAELTLGLMLSLARRIPQHNASAKTGSWSRVTGIELTGKTLGIVGLGRIGSRVAEMCRRAFRMRVLGYDPYVEPAHAAELGVELVTDLHTLLSQADLVSVHVPLKPETRGLIGTKELRAMKPTSYLINTARGGLVDEGALYRALRKGWIAGAASDVFAQEPPVDNPLLELDNFIATPHVGANTYESVQRMGVLASENALKVLRGERPLYVVNPEVYQQAK